MICRIKENDGHGNYNFYEWDVLRRALVVRAALGPCCIFPGDLCIVLETANLNGVKYGIVLFNGQLGLLRNRYLEPA